MLALMFYISYRVTQSHVTQSKMTIFERFKNQINSFGFWKRSKVFIFEFYYFEVVNGATFLCHPVYFS